MHPLHCVCSLETAQSRLYIGPASKQRCLSACLMHTGPLCVHAGWPASAFDTLNVVCCTIYEAMLCCQHEVASQQNLLAAVPPFMAALLSNRAAQHAEPACFQQYCWRTTSGGGASAQYCVAKTCVPVSYCTVILGLCWLLFCCWHVARAVLCRATNVSMMYRHPLSQSDLPTF